MRAVGSREGRSNGHDEIVISHREGPGGRRTLTHECPRYSDRRYHIGDRISGEEREAFEYG